MVFGSSIISFQCAIQVLVGERGGDDRAQACLVERHRREHDRGGEHALLEEAAGEPDRGLRITDDDRRDRGLGPAGVEAESRELGRASCRERVWIPV